MSLEFESQYVKNLKHILHAGDKREGRNGYTWSLPGLQLNFDVSVWFPILTKRRIYYKGVAGEYASFIRQANHVNTFKRWGCNFWNSWADESGYINADYGNAWIDYNETNQMEQALNMLKYNPHSRRIMIDAWRPDRINELSLPCCHFNYQFYANKETKTLDLIWTQRSADWMIGVPSDAITATIMLNQFADLAMLKPRRIIMNFGDAHIYDDHKTDAGKYLIQPSRPSPKYEFATQHDLYSFIPSDLKIIGYEPSTPIKFDLKV